MSAAPPKLKYEEYHFAAVHVLLRIQALWDAGVAPVDHLIIKWLLLRVFKLDPQHKAQISERHKRYAGVIQKLLLDNLIAVVHSFRLGATEFRVLVLHPLCCPAAEFLALSKKKDNEERGRPPSAPNGELVQ